MVKFLHKLTAEIQYSINFTENKKNCLSLHYNGADNYLFVNGTEIIKFKGKDEMQVFVKTMLEQR